MNYRKRIIQLVTFLGGLYYFLEFVLPAKIGSFEFGKYNDQIIDGFRVVGAMAIGLGLINILSVYGSQLIFKRRGWINSLALLTGMFVMLFAGAQDWLVTLDNSKDAERFLVLKTFSLAIVSDQQSGRKNVPTAHERNMALQKELGKELGSIRSALEADAAMGGAGDVTDPRFSRAAGNLADAVTETSRLSNALVTRIWAAESDAEANKLLAVSLGVLVERRREYLDLLYARSFTSYFYRLLYDGLFVALGSAMFALLGFYMASAAYRAFRVRSMESGLMMGAALLVMLGQIPFGIWLYGGFPDLRLWILEVPNAAAFRAIALGASIAGLVMAFRMWLSIESDSFGESK